MNLRGLYTRVLKLKQSKCFGIGQNKQMEQIRWDPTVGICRQIWNLEKSAGKYLLIDYFHQFSWGTQPSISQPACRCWVIFSHRSNSADLFKGCYKLVISLINRLLVYVLYKLL